MRPGCLSPRTGSSFAATEFGVSPDLMVSARGITNASVPLSVVFISDNIYDTCMQLARASVEFYHGYTCSCHPVACAAGMATLDIYERENLLAGVKPEGGIGQYRQQSLHSLMKKLPWVLRHSPLPGTKA